MRPMCAPPRAPLPRATLRRDAVAVPACRACPKPVFSGGGGQAGGRLAAAPRAGPSRHVGCSAGGGAARRGVAPARGAAGERGAGRPASRSGPGRGRAAKGKAAGAGLASAGSPPPPQNRPPVKRGGRAKPRLGFKIVYIMQDSGYVAKGLVVHSMGFDQYMRDRVGPWHRDDAGAETISKMFSNVGMSDFERDEMRALLSAPPQILRPERIGESFAECFLVDYENALFPHPYLRDVKSVSASHAGPDLVGYSPGGPDGAPAMFLFGEVKTSGEGRRPPRVAGNLADQLASLCQPGARKVLIRRLTFKAAERRDPRLAELYSESMSSYLAGKFRLVGVLIRDLAADRRDIEAAFSRALSSRCAERLDVISLYLPAPLGRLGGMLE